MFTYRRRMAFILTVCAVACCALSQTLAQTSQPASAPAAAPASQPARLPQNSPWHKTLRDYMATLAVKDFECPPRTLPPRPPAQSKAGQEGATPAELYKAALLYANKPPAYASDKAPAEQFLLESIETPKGIMVPGGLPMYAAWLAQWNDPLNAFFGSEGLKRKAFVSAAVDMIMLDDLHGKDPAVCRSDCLGGTLIWLAYTHMQCKDVLPPDIQQAYEAGLRTMADKILKWGTTGLMTDMDMRGPLGLFYAAKALGDDKLMEAAKEYGRKMFADLKHYNPAGYFVDFGCFDVSYNGMATYFATWLALATDWPFVKEAVTQNYRLRSHLILPEPQGGFAFGPSHCSARTSADSFGEQWNWPYRHAGAAMVTDEAMFLSPLPSEKEMIGKYERLADYIKTWTPPKPRRWAEKHWDQSMVFSYDYYVQGFVEKRMKLEAEKSDLLKPAMLRSGDFVRDFAKVFLIAKFGDFGVVIHTGPVQLENPLQGFSGGCLSAVWSRQTGSVILGRCRGYEAETDDARDHLDQWRIMPVHSISGLTEAGNLVMTSRIRRPNAEYKIADASAQVVVSNQLQPEPNDTVNVTRGAVQYTRKFEVSAKGVRVTSQLSGDGKTVMKELYEIIPVLLSEVGKQARSPKPDAAIFFLSDGKWIPAIDAPVTATEARIDRWSHSMRIVFDGPVKVQLSPQIWTDGYMSKTTCRNIMVDLVGGSDDKKRLQHVSVSYLVDSQVTPAPQGEQTPEIKP